MSRYAFAVLTGGSECAMVVDVDGRSRWGGWTLVSEYAVRFGAFEVELANSIWRKVGWGVLRAFDFHGRCEIIISHLHIRLSIGVEFVPVLWYTTVGLGASAVMGWSISLLWIALYSLK